METYAEVLARKEKEFQIKDQSKVRREKEAMSNYDMDELRRQGKVPDDEDARERDRNAFASTKKTSVTLQDDEKLQTVEIEMDKDALLKLALAAHDRDITLNRMCSHIIADSMDSLDYRFEHQTKPTVLKEY